MEEVEKKQWSIFNPPFVCGLCSSFLSSYPFSLQTVGPINCPFLTLVLPDVTSCWKAVLLSHCRQVLTQSRPSHHWNLRSNNKQSSSWNDCCCDPVLNLYWKWRTLKKQFSFHYKDVLHNFKVIITLKHKGKVTATAPPTACREHWLTARKKILQMQLLQS